jgi:hypothetical protein
MLFIVQQDRLWEKIKRKIGFAPPHKNYYDNMPIKPGFHFYRALAQSKVPLKFLNVNIPETFVTIENTYWIGNFP